VPRHVEFIYTVPTNEIGEIGPKRFERKATKSRAEPFYSPILPIRHSRESAARNTGLTAAAELVWRGVGILYACHRGRGSASASRCQN
jgi:hypothetical protein